MLQLFPFQGPLPKRPAPPNVEAEIKPPQKGTIHKYICVCVALHTTAIVV